MRTVRLIGTCLSLALTIATRTAAAQCTPSWDNRFGLPTGADVSAITTFDFDGAGPDPARLVVAGNFTTSAGVSISGLGWTDGATWTAFGGAVAGGSINAIAFHDFDGTGPLPAHPVVGGTFTSMGGVAANFVARWNGAAWEPLGDGIASGTNFGVHALASYDPDGTGPQAATLYVGGLFQASGPTTVNCIAQWNGASWQPVGTGVTGSAGAMPGVRFFQVYDADGPGAVQPRLLVAGGFFGPGSNIAQWNGASWSSMGSLSNHVGGLTLHDSDGNGPTLPRPVVAQSGSIDALISFWNGASWSSSSTFVSNGIITAIASHDPDDAGPLLPSVYACGNFQSPVRTLARWTGSAWVVVSTAASGVTVAINDMTVWDRDGAGPENSVLAVGSVNLPPSSFTPALAGLGLWNGLSWSTVGTGLADGSRVTNITNLAMFDLDGAAGPLPRSMIAAGSLRSDGAGTAMPAYARWDGNAWVRIGAGTPGVIRSLLIWDRDGAGPLEEEMYGAALETSSGGSTSASLLRWNGELMGTIAVSPGGTAAMNSIVAFDPDGAGPLEEQIIAGGEFNTGEYLRVARWDGTGWQPMGAGFDGRVRMLKVLDLDGPGPQGNTLLAAGDFTRSGTAFVTRVAQWDGAAWQPMGSLGAPVYDLEMYDPDGDGPGAPQLIAGGEFGTASPSGVARWNGTTWVQLGNGLRQGSINGGVESLSTFDPDGPGPQQKVLLAGGRFTFSGAALSIPGFAMWNGTAWSALASSIAATGTFSSAVLETLPLDPDGDGPTPSQLVVAGRFTGIAGMAAGSVAMWKPSVPPRIIESPADAEVCISPTPGIITLEVLAEAWPLPEYQWRRDGSPLSDGGSPGGAVVSGTTTAFLTITNPNADDDGEYDCVVTNACSSATSDVAIVTLITCETCNADYNQDGGADTADIIDLANDIASGTQSFPPNTTDFNSDGGGDFGDILDLANVVAGGECP